MQPYHSQVQGGNPYYLQDYWTQQAQVWIRIRVFPPFAAASNIVRDFLERQPNKQTRQV